MGGKVGVGDGVGKVSGACVTHNQGVGVNRIQPWGGGLGVDEGRRDWQAAIPSTVTINKMTIFFSTTFSTKLSHGCYLREAGSGLADGEIIESNVHAGLIIGSGDQAHIADFKTSILAEVNGGIINDQQER